MARKKSEFLSGFGTAMEIFKSLTDAVLERGGADNDLRRIITDAKLRSALAEIIVSEPSTGYAVTVDYDIALRGMIRRGAYDYVNSDITQKHFPVECEGEQTLVIELVHFDVVMTSERVIEELEQRGLRPATLPELLALGASYPDLQRQFPIVALGSGWRCRRGFRYVPSLWSFAHERNLSLHWFGDRWFRYVRFAAVRTEH